MVDAFIILKIFLHVLRDDSTAKEIWRKVIPNESSGSFFDMGLFRWVKSNLQSDLTNPVVGEVNWSCLFDLLT